MLVVLNVLNLEAHRVQELILVLVDLGHYEYRPHTYVSSRRIAAS